MSRSRNAKPSAMVGLDIGSDMIKVAEARYGKDGITITGLGVAPIPEGVVENEVIVDPKAMGSVIKSALAEAGIKSKKVVSSVSGQSRVVVRVIEVPQMSGKELAETMKWEVERHVPFPPNEVVMDFHPLRDSDPNAQNMEVLLAVAQQELVNNHVQAVQAAGLKPVAIDIEPLAASRSLVEVGGNNVQGGVFAIVNIGCNNTDLSIFEDGVLTFPSPPLGIAGINFTREVAEALGQTLEQAEVTKKEYAAVDLDAMEAASGGGFGADAFGGSDDSPGGAEPTSFNTSVGPSFDMGGDPSASADGGPAANGGFMNTIDGPMFDVDPMGGPAFGGAEASEPEEPGAPLFDFGGAGETQEQQQQDGPMFDLGSGDSGFNIGGEDVGDRPVTPAFDLDDDEPVSMEPEQVTPSLDLSDARDQADPGDRAEPTRAAPVDRQPVAVMSASGDTQKKVFQAIQGVLADLATELRRSLEYYGTKYSKVPQRIYLCGGTAKMPNLDKYLSNELGITVEVADPVKLLSVKVPSASPQYLKEISPLFSVSIGLAIRDMVG